MTRKPFPLWVSVSAWIAKWGIYYAAGIIIWIIIYGWLKQIAIDHKDVVVDYGPGAVLVAIHRKRIARAWKKTKEIIAKH
jgi:hypothetical protein